MITIASFLRVQNDYDDWINKNPNQYHSFHSFFAYLCERQFLDEKKMEEYFDKKIGRKTNMEDY